MKVEMFDLKLLEIASGDDLIKIIIEHAEKECGGLMKDDILVITSKIISKNQNLLIEMDKVTSESEAGE